MIQLNNMKRKKQHSGQSLVEVLVATAVVGIVMTAIAAGLLLSVKNTAISKYRAIANAKAQEGLEVFRRERSLLGWTSFVASLREGTICLNSLPSSGDTFSGYIATNANACTGGTEEAGSTFTREADIQVTSVGGGTNNQVRVEVIVSWTDGDTVREVSLVQEFKEY